MTVGDRERERNRRPPIIVDFYGFEQLADAFAYIIDRPESSHNVSVKLELARLLAVVNGGFGTEQTIRLEAFGKEATLPRHTVKYPQGISVSADPDPHPYNITPVRTINIQVGNLEDPDLDRGLAWVLTENPDNPFINFHLKAQQYTEAKLKKTFDRVNHTVIDYLQEALDGKIPIEHPQR